MLGTPLGRILLDRTISTYAQRVLATQPARLLGYWPHGEASGTAMLDSSPTRRHGVYTNATLGAAGIDPTGSAVTLAATGYGSLAASGIPAVFSGAAGTLAQWIRLTEAAHTDVTVRKASSFQIDSSNRVYLYKGSTNTDAYGAVYAAGGTSKTVEGTYLSASGGGWRHLVVTWDAARDRVRLYLDGAQVGADATGLGVWAGANPTSLIGATNTVPAQPWSGDLQHSALWGAELTAAEIANLYRIQRHTIVWEGDSRTAGTGATNLATAYPSQAIRKLAGNWQATNVATSGETVATMLTQLASQIAPRWSATALGNVAVLWGGVNDNTDAATMYSRIASWHSQVQALGYQTVCCTEIDAQDASHLASDWHATEYQALNVLLRATPPGDALADLGGEATLQDATNTTYFNADKVHLTDAGYAVVATVVAAAVATL